MIAFISSVGIRGFLGGVLGEIRGASRSTSAGVLGADCSINVVSVLCLSTLVTDNSIVPGTEEPPDRTRSDFRNYSETRWPVARW